MAEITHDEVPTQPHHRLYVEGMDREKRAVRLIKVCDCIIEFFAENFYDNMPLQRVFEAAYTGCGASEQDTLAAIGTMWLWLSDTDMVTFNDSAFEIVGSLQNRLMADIY